MGYNSGDKSLISVLKGIKELSMDNPLVFVVNSDTTPSDDKVTDDIKLQFHMKGNVSYISKAKESERIIAGYASIIEIDSENQFIPKATLEDSIRTLLGKSDYANLMITHQNIQIGKILEGWGDYKTHIDDKGLFIVASIRDDLEISNEIWSKITNGKINGFSIAAEVLLAHDECDDKSCYTVIDKMNMFEVSVCEYPINEKSGFVVVSKSEDCEKCNINKGKSMNKDEEIEKSEVEEEVIEEKSKVTETKEQPTEEKSETSEETTEPEVEEKSEVDTKEILNGLTREIEALKGIVSELAKKPEEEPMDEEEPEEETMMSEEKANDECTDCEEKSYDVQKDISDLKKAISELTSYVKKSEEIEVTLKSKDDEIAELSKRIEVLEKTEKPKTVVKEDTESKEEVEEPKYKSSIVHDKLRPGTIYRDLD